MALAKKKLFALNHFFCGLTPELRRTALRRRVGSITRTYHDAAKRCRLERIVRPHRDLLDVVKAVQCPGYVLNPVENEAVPPLTINRERY